jgi:hypothetical protein
MLHLALQIFCDSTIMLETYGCSYKQREKQEDRLLSRPPKDPSKC